MRKYIQQCISGFDTIPDTRKILLSGLADYIREKYVLNVPVHLHYICTHNSRRSHFGQIAGAMAAKYYAVDQVYTYSGGTEATAVNTQVMQVVKLNGLEVYPLDQLDNPRYQIRFGFEDELICFSKIYDHSDNPAKDFAAIMTCSEAEEACPLIPGAEKRFVITYEDPKVADGTDHALSEYRSRFEQILTENLYIFSRV